jgi:hypothetical protein
VPDVGLRFRESPVSATTYRLTMDAPPLFKYPRTQHLEGSRLQPGDEDLEAVAFAELAGSFLVVEEKVDGANVGLGFDAGGELWLQSRGHHLTGGPRERQFAPLKAWASAHSGALLDVLEDRYTLFGEWCYAKHTVFYDALPHYLLEFDVYDRVDELFLSTERRRELLAPLEVVCSVPVVYSGTGLRSVEALAGLVGPSLYKTPRWREHLAAQAARAGVDPARAAAESDGSDLAEGLYVKQEGDGRVLGRFKWIRPGFVQALVASGSHWAERPQLENLLADGVDLYSARIPRTNRG